ncbi:hypothetical protein C427_3026 [Paraglaciecola psychrophila 170]|uniref:Uncharacterized protein n=1 Tax=Paraglaciecola psychrophila 170 TaxID=1129794 RepID=M4RNB0_9ALTE|nr:hypothetical protein C427_3026 [Paraglaciecola psychrophila 170]
MIKTNRVNSDKIDCVAPIVNLDVHFGASNNKIYMVEK